MEQEQNRDGGTQTTSVLEVAAKFGNLNHLRMALIEQGHEVIEVKYMNWSYVEKIMKGEKLLLKAEDLTDFVMLPKYIKKNESSSKR